MRALAAGVDLVLAAGTTPVDADRVSFSVFAAVLAAARSGRLSRATLAAAYERIARLKATLR